MDPVTHAAAGVICSRFISSPSRQWAALAGAILALLPDIDYFLIFWDRLAFIRHHRGITHSLLALPLLALLGALVGRALGGPRWFRPLFRLGLVVLASHLLLDLATSYGTQILSPFSHQRFTLDLIFIVDPYFTGVLLLGAAAALSGAAWARRAAGWSLAAAGAYLLVCGFYQQQALALAHQLFDPPYLGRRECGLTRRLPKGPPWQSFPQGGNGLRVAALPQPFSCRRWHLVAADAEGVRQAFVELPVTGWMDDAEPEGDAPAAPPPAVSKAPTYQPPPHLTVYTWEPVNGGTVKYGPESRKILDTFLEFARFPLLHTVRRDGRGQFLEWRDLRFAMPGRALPFVLQLRLDPEGGLKSWVLGRWSNQ